MTGAPAGSVTVSSIHEPVMGTYLQLQLTAATERAATGAEATVLAEAARLEALFTRFRPDSDLVRWCSGADAAPGPELGRLLALAATWFERSGGAFHPCTAALTTRWDQAAAEGVEPEPVELAGLVAAAAELPFRVGADGSIERVGECGEVDVHALAKGHVVDLLAATVLAEHPVERLVINAGGDLLHRGAGVLRVGVEDPHRAYDNEPPRRRIAVADRAVATSGSARRWFSVGGRRFSRVLDPRTGRPVTHSSAATVVAPDAATADVLATVCSVLAPEEAAAFVAALAAGDAADDGLACECLVVTGEGIEHRSPGWDALEI